MHPKIKILFFCLSTILFIGCDRVTKELAKSHLMNRPSGSYLHNSFQLVYVENTGAAMSLGDDLPESTGFWLLGMLPLLLLLALTASVIRRSKENSLPKMLSFALIIAGGLGNIIDRIIFDRHVTDFMIISIFHLHTGIFNVADLCITAGAIGLIFFYKDRKSKQIIT